MHTALSLPRVALARVIPLIASRYRAPRPPPRCSARLPRAAPGRRSPPKPDRPCGGGRAACAGSAVPTAAAEQQQQQRGPTAAEQQPQQRGRAAARPRGGGRHSPRPGPARPGPSRGVLLPPGGLRAPPAPPGRAAAAAAGPAPHRGGILPSARRAPEVNLGLCSGVNKERDAPQPLLQEV